MLKAKFVIIFWSALFGGISATTKFNLSDLCALTPGSLVRVPNSCTNWYKCPSSPEALDSDEGSCVHGLHFNKNTGKCEHKDKVNCPFINVFSSNKNRCAHEKEGTFLPVEGQCNAYIYCKAGVEKKSYCPNNLVFHAKRGECVYGSQYKCPESKPKSESDLICNCVKEGLFFADKHDCGKYNLCNKGVLERRSCNSSYAWNYLEHKCVSLDDVKCHPTAKKPEPELRVCVGNDGPVSDGVSCSGYYFCKKISNDTHDRKPEHFTCDSGLFFDSQTLSCRDRVNVKCDLDRCEGMGNKYVNVAGDCRAYGLCSNNKLTTRGLCPSTHYFDERTQGCTEQVVKYVACSV